MPRCNNAIHALTERLPASLPVEDFYVRPNGTLFHACRHCSRLLMRLRKRYGHTTLPQHLIREAWQCYWRYQEAKEKRDSPDAGERWCSRGHPVAAKECRPPKNGTTASWCRDCHAIASIQSYHRQRHGIALTWEDAMRRHFLSGRAAVRRKNAAAPTGEHWCGRHRGYYRIPENWIHRKGRNLSWCPTCASRLHRAWQRARRARRAAEAAD